MSKRHRCPVLQLNYINYGETEFICEVTHIASKSVKLKHVPRKGKLSARTNAVNKDRQKCQQECTRTHKLEHANRSYVSGSVQVLYNCTSGHELHWKSLVTSNLNSCFGNSE